MGSNWMMVMMLVSLFGPVPAVMAAESVDTGKARPGSSCHPFLLATECARYQSGEAAIGAERSRLLAERDALIREREQACNCSRLSEAIVLQPAARKAKLSF